MPDAPSYVRRGCRTDRCSGRRIGTRSANAGARSEDTELVAPGIREHDPGNDNRKIQYAVLCAGAIAGGLEPDLLDEVIWWGTDNFWRYGLLAAVVLIRASADRRGVSVEQVVAELAERHGVALPEPLANR